MTGPRIAKDPGLLVNRKTTDFDVYVGLSAGAFLGAPLAAGISPGEMIRSLEGASEKFSMFHATDFYNPNLREFVGDREDLCCQPEMDSGHSPVATPREESVISEIADIVTADLNNRWPPCNQRREACHSRMTISEPHEHDVILVPVFEHPRCQVPGGVLASLPGKVDYGVVTGEQGPIRFDERCGLPVYEQ